MDLGGTIEVGGDAVRISLPSTAREVLEYVSFLAVRHDETIGGEMEGHADAVANIVAWLGRYIAGGPDWVDEHMTPGQIASTAGDIVAAASMPSDTLDAIREWAKVVGSGGCECPKCEDPEKFDEASERTRQIVLEQCRFRDVDDGAVSVAANTRAARDGDLLDGPWWLYQIHNAVETGLYLGRKQRDNNRNRGKSLREELR